MVLSPASTRCDVRPTPPHPKKWDVPLAPFDPRPSPRDDLGKVPLQMDTSSELSPFVMRYDTTPRHPVLPSTPDTGHSPDLSTPPPSSWLVRPPGTSTAKKLPLTSPAPVRVHPPPLPSTSPSVARRVAAQLTEFKASHAQLTQELQAVKQENAALWMAQRELQAAAEGAQVQHSDMRQDAKAVVDTCSSMRGHLLSAAREACQGTQHRAEIADRLVAAEERAAALEAELRKCREMWEGLPEVSPRRLFAECEQLSREKRALQDESAQLRADISWMEGTVAKLVAQNTELQEKDSALQEAGASLQTELEQVTHQALAVVAEREAMLSTLARSQNSCDELMVETVRQQAYIAFLETSSDELAQRCSLQVAAFQELSERRTRALTERGMQSDEDAYVLELQAELHHLSHEGLSLQQAVEKIKAERDVALQEKDTLQREIETMQGGYRELAEQQRKAAEKSDQNGERALQLQRLVSRLQADLERVTKDLTRADEKAEAQRVAWETQRSRMAKEVGEGKDRIAELEQALGESAECMRQLQEGNDRLTKQLKAHQADEEASRMKMTALQEELRQSKEALEARGAELAEAQECGDGLRRRLAEEQQKTSAQESKAAAQLRALEEELQGERHRSQQLRTCLAEAEREQVEAKEVIGRLHEEQAEGLARVDTMARHLQDRSHAFLEESRKLRHEALSAKSRCQSVERQLREASARRPLSPTSPGEVARLQADCARKASDLAMVEAKVMRLEGDLSRDRAENSRLKAHAAGLEEELTRRQEECGRMTAELCVLREESTRCAAAAQSREGVLLRDIAELRERLQGAVLGRTAEASREAQLTEQLGALRRELDSLKAATQQRLQDQHASATVEGELHNRARALAEEWTAHERQQRAKVIDELRAAKQEAHRSRDAAERTAKELAQARRAVEAAEATIAELEEANSERRTHAAQQVIAELEDELHRAQCTLRSYAEANSHLEAQLQAAESSSDTAVSSLQEENARLQDQVAERDEQLAAQCSKVLHLQNQLHQLYQKMGDIYNDQQAHAVAATQAREEVAKLQQLCMEANQRLEQELQTHSTESQRFQERSEQEKESLRQQYDAMLTAERARKEEAEALSKELRDELARAAAKGASVESSVKRLEEIESKFETVINAAQDMATGSLHSVTAALRMELQEQLGYSKSLQQQLAAAEAGKEELQCKLEAVIAHSKEQLRAASRRAEEAEREACILRESGSLSSSAEIEEWHNELQRVTASKAQSEAGYRARVEDLVTECRRLHEALQYKDEQLNIAMARDSERAGVVEELRSEREQLQLAVRRREESLRDAKAALEQRETDMAARDEEHKAALKKVQETSKEKEGELASTISKLTTEAEKLRGALRERGERHREQLAALRLEIDPFRTPNDSICDSQASPTTCELLEVRSGVALISSRAREAEHEAELLMQVARIQKETVTFIQSELDGLVPFESVGPLTPPPPPPPPPNTPPTLPNGPSQVSRASFISTSLSEAHLVSRLSRAKMQAVKTVVQRSAEQAATLQHTLSTMRENYERAITELAEARATAEHRAATAEKELEKAVSARSGKDGLVAELQGEITRLSEIREQSLTEAAVERAVLESDLAHTAAERRQLEQQLARISAAAEEARRGEQRALAERASLADKVASLRNMVELQARDTVQSKATGTNLSFRLLLTDERAERSELLVEESSAFFLISEKCRFRMTQVASAMKMEVYSATKQWKSIKQEVWSFVTVNVIKDEQVHRLKVHCEYAHGMLDIGAKFRAAGLELERSCYNQDVVSDYLSSHRSVDLRPTACWKNIGSGKDRSHPSRSLLFLNPPTSSSESVSSDWVPDVDTQGLVVSPPPPPAAHSPPPSKGRATGHLSRLARHM